MKKEYRFREWIELEEKQEAIVRAIEKVEERFPELITDFISIALSLDNEEISKKPWIEVIKLFSEVCSSLKINSNLPILHPPKEEHKKDAWDYEGRGWHYYVHKIAKAYGWTMEYISFLRVEDALSQIQEILTNEQLEHEFLWGMSEASVTYDKFTKETKPNPLPRPYWMTQAKEADLPIQKMKIPKDMLPIGAVDYSALPDEFKPKAIND